MARQSYIYAATNRTKLLHNGYFDLTATVAKFGA